MLLMLVRCCRRKARSSIGFLLLIHPGNKRFCAALSSPRPVVPTDNNFLIDVGRKQLSGLFDFPLDDWQLIAGGAIYNGHNVIVSAPTGAGKTVIGEMALAWSRSNQQKGIYTTPLKALSNEKFRDFCGIFGRNEIGLSTGDVSINKGANITVMTTEVYRNIAWRSSIPSQDGIDAVDALGDNSVVVLDELHYMGLPGRGGVWEECIITSPHHTQIVGLSATLSNGPEIAAWVESVTKRRTLLVEVPSGKRPVPLRYLYATKSGLSPLFRDPDAGPGAPHGLLGYRGDGEPIDDRDRGKKRKKKGFDSTEDTANKIPRGLNVSPSLTGDSAKRLLRIDRVIERKKVALRFGKRGSDFEFDHFLDKSDRGSSRKLSARQEQKERERLLRKELRRSVPTMHAVVHRLNQKDLLPAIFFIFSRARCDDTAGMVARCFMGPNMMEEEFDDFGTGRRSNSKRKTRQRSRRGPIVEDVSGRGFRSSGDYLSEEVFMAMMEDSVPRDDPAPLAQADGSPLSEARCRYYGEVGLLSFHKVMEVASKIRSFNLNNAEIAFDDDLIEQYLLGVGSHHAGMLPAHKSFVEILFQNQLMKVVFATETLAAGINMPARSTAICALAKRGSGSSMEQLETSNLLQMAGRAGRRGKDTEGTCVILASPFETHDDAARILLGEIKPITSQFSPSYSLCLNLIARGEGTMAVAKQLVSKSFAMWQQGQSVDNASAAEGQNLRGTFLETLAAALKANSGFISDRFETTPVSALLTLLEDRGASLKKASKLLQGANKSVDLEEATLSYLQREYNASRENDRDEEGIDMSDIVTQLEVQEKRVQRAKDELRRHPFSAVAEICNTLIKSGSVGGKRLAKSLAKVRSESDVDPVAELSAVEVSSFAKAAIVSKRKTPSRVNANEVGPGDAWEQFVAMTKTLVEYGCLSPKEAEASDNIRYEVTDAGQHCGFLGFENSLWVLLAMGSVWGKAETASLDMLSTTSAIVDNELDDPHSEVKPKNDADEILAILTSMTASQLAGYVSCIIGERSNRETGLLIEQFQQIDSVQQQAIRMSFTVLDRFGDVQESCGVSQDVSGVVDISNCASVSAWAAGASWQETLAMSGLPPGDLARTLSRVLDAVRQLGKLPYLPKRRGNVGSRGLDPSIKQLCREAARAISRYPVKDTFMLGEDDEEDEEEETAVDEMEE